MRFLRLPGMVCLLAVSFAMQARAQESSWHKTFIPEAVGSYLPDQHDLLIAAAGEVSTNLTSAARALESAFRKSGRAGLVMDSASLGSLAGLDDTQIVRKARALPIDRVAVLRLFPAAPGEPWRAVVTLYDKAGSAEGAFSAIAGAPLDMAEETRASSPGQGVDPRAAAEVAGKVVNYKPGGKAQQTYDRYFVGFHVGPTMAQPYQGTDMRLLRGADFYLAVGREDLADKYKFNEGAKLTISALGVVTSLVGMALMFHAYTEYDPILDENARFWSTEQIVGCTLAGVGAVAAVVPWFVSSYPVQGEDAVRLVDEHNRKLRAKLGLPEDEASLAPRVSRAGSRLALSPAAFASPGGAAFGVAGRY